MVCREDMQQSFVLLAAFDKGQGRARAILNGIQNTRKQHPGTLIPVNGETASATKVAHSENAWLTVKVASRTGRRICKRTQTAPAVLRLYLMQAIITFAKIILQGSMWCRVK